MAEQTSAGKAEQSTEIVSAELTLNNILNGKIEDFAMFYICLGV